MRLLVTLEKDLTHPALSEAIEETIIRAMQKTEDLPPTLFLNKMCYPSMMLLTLCPKESVNIEACKTHGINIFRCALELNTALVYRDKDMWEVHYYDYAENVNEDLEINRQLFSKISISFFQRFGINASLEPINNLMVNGRKIAWSDVQFIGKVFHYDFNILQDFPFDLVPKLYGVEPKHLPTLERMTTMKEELGRYVEDPEVLSNVKASFKGLVIGELTDFEKSILVETIKKYVREDWNLYGDVLLQKIWLYRKCINRLSNHLTLHGIQSDYFRPVTRYCSKLCPAYSKCVAQTVPAKTIKDQLEFCKEQAENFKISVIFPLDSFLLEATEIVS